MALGSLSDYTRVIQTATVAGAGTHTTNAALPGYVDLTFTGSTAAIAVPTNGANRKTIEYVGLNTSGADCVVTFNSSIRLSTGLSSRAFTVPTGQYLFAAIKYSTINSTTIWTLVAAAVSST